MDGHAIALLMARHWQATYEYSVICLASWSGSASMAAAAAFHRVLGRAGDGALRPQLLVAVREFVKEWAADDEISAVLPELRKTIGGRGLRAARSATPERRQLAERAFRALPGASQCLLWHSEVEAEPISVPAGLLGVDASRAAAALEQAREQFRTGCVRAHRELAPTSECRFYNRLLDVPIRRGGGLLPDVRAHLTDCRYCRHAAEQLSHFEGGLEVLLAETVLGWGAHRYLDSRPARSAERPAQAPPGAARAKPGGRHRPVPAGLLAQPSKSARAVLVGAGLTSLVLLATVLVAKGWSDDGSVPTPGATWGAVSGNTVRPTPSTVSQDAGSPSTASMGNPVEVGHGRLRNADAGLCLDTQGAHHARAAAGTKAVLTECSSAGSQQWSYQEDGLLRSAADPRLCLDSDTEKRSVVVADCLTRAGEVRYDLTVRGELLLRRGKGLLVAPGKGEAVVVTERNGSQGQRWLLEFTDESAPAQQGTQSPDDEETGRPSGGPNEDPVAPHLAPAPPSGSDDHPDGRPEDSPGRPSDQHGTPSQQYGTRVAQVDDSDSEPATPAAPAERAGAVVGAVVDTATSVTAPLASTLGNALP
ncbi:RICIN domain-containing protein [Streptomyces canus]|uniref:RICIN domain-containing protein n=1 Tax=Streptomyces canus TaxID=58343 RepID=UPI00224DB4EF|nr:RICIN domain-containing protein [Streptomyces canus]MCX5259836.1 RICIN domain-containing protein [Streptomyces canus]